MIFHSSQDDKFKQEIVQSFYNLYEVIKEKICRLCKGNEWKLYVCMDCYNLLCAAMAVARGFLRSNNIVKILYIYLILGGVTTKNQRRKHTKNNQAIIFISKELANQKALPYCAKLIIEINFS